MRKKLLFVATMMMVCMSVNAQKSSHLLNIGVSPYNTFKSSLEFEDYKDFNVNYRYNSGWNISLGYERQWKIVLLAVEGSYGQTKFDKLEINNLPEGMSFNPPTLSDNIQQANFNAMVGWDIGTFFGNSFSLNHENHDFDDIKLRRFQLPVYLGLGYSYLDDGLLDNKSCFNINYKIRARYYVSNTIATFVGWNVVVPVVITKSEEEIPDHVSRYLDLGVTINL